MKTSFLRPLLSAGLALWLGHVPDASGALGLISTELSPLSPVTVGATVTVTVSISGYSEATEIDGYDFAVTYPAALFTFVSGSFSHGTTAAGVSQQWLARANQEAEAAGYTPDNLDDGSLDGLVTISFSDAGFNLPETGTNAPSGFLVSFSLLAAAPGSGVITPGVTSPGAPVFFDVDLNSVTGAPAFAGSPITVVPEPAALALSFGGALLILRRRRHRG